MREIKFRAWDKKNKVMKTVTELDFDYYPSQKREWKPQGAKSDVWLNNENESYFPTDVELMQITGLRDKNGKEIYEGDCLGHRHNIVEWYEGAFCVAGDRPLSMMAKHCEVIGNIYEGVS